MTITAEQSHGVTTPKKFELCFVGDRSGSMISMGEAPWKGVLKWTNDQAGEARKNNHDTRITVVFFDDESTCVVDSASASHFIDITPEQAQKWMKPRGCTRLFDTTIEELEILRNKKNKRGQDCEAVFALFTDGRDNVSEKNLSEMNKAVKNAREEGIVCYFLAANQDAIATGHRYGFDRDRCLTTGADPETSSQAYKNLSEAVYRSINTPHLDKGFTQLERESSAPPL